MKEAINLKLPNCKSELSWIIDKTGQVLFKEKWNDFKPPQLCKIKESANGAGIICIIGNNFKNDEQNELLNYLFSTSLNKLIKD